MTARIFLSVVVAGWLMASGSLLAHHSLSATYDVRKESSMSGVVKAVKFSNPHGALELTVKNPDGTTTDWVLTTGSANVLASIGFDKKTIKAGDTVTVDIYGSRDGKPLGFMRRITLADNRQFEFETK